MDERDEFGTDAPTQPMRSGSPLPPDSRSAGEQAGPAMWSDRVPGAASSTEENRSRGGEPLRQVQGVAHKAAEKASALAHEAGGQVQEVVNRKKDEAAERLSRLAGSVREAARSLHQQDPGGLGRYVDTAAEKLDRVSGYLRERDLQGFLRETEALARRRPALFLAGSVVIGIAFARFLKSTSRRPHPVGGDGMGEM